MIGRILFRNISASILLKVSALILQLALLPLLVQVLGPIEYGIWVTMQAVVGWFTLLDLGISNGVRNKVTASLSVSQEEEARAYLSSAFFGQLGLWSILASISAWIAFGCNLPWASFFLSPTTDRAIATGLFLCLMTLIVSQWLGLSNAVLYARHWNALTAIAPLLAGGLLLLGLLAARWSDWTFTLERIAVASFSTYLIAYVVQWLVVFKLQPELEPSWKSFSKNRLIEVMSLGGRFFVIQLAFIAIFATDRWIVLRYLGPESATQYDIVFRLFSLATAGFSMLIGPVWAMVGAAWAIRNGGELLRLFRFTLVGMGLAMIATLALALAIRWLVYHWIDARIVLAPVLIASFVVYSFIVVWNAGFANLLNGIGRTREQTLTSVVACVINIPLSIGLCQLPHLGIAGVVLASSISLMLFAIAGPVAWWDSLRSCMTSPLGTDS